MALVIDETYLPAIFTVGPMTDAEFARFCAEHPDLQIELTADGQLIVMPQTFTLTGARNNEISAQLRNWARADKRGIAFDSSTGWVLPNGARRSPDAAWVLKQKIQGMDPASFSGYWRLCPDFVIELRSQTDRMRTLREKMADWMTNGAQLAWLIDPEMRSVEVYRAGTADPEVMMNPTRIAGEGLVAGFTLDLIPVWDPFAD